MTFIDSFTPSQDLFFLDDAAVPTLQRLGAESAFSARGLLQHTGNSRSRTGQALRAANAQWLQILDSTAETFSHHLSEVTDFIHSAFRADSDLKAAL